MKYLRIFILLTCCGLLIASTAEAQHKSNIFEQSISSAADSTEFSIYQLQVLTPANNFTATGSANLVNPFPPYRPIKGITKSLLIFGTDLIRDDENSIYSFENAWKYPGPTVEYSQSSTELELFLERFNTYAGSSQ